MLRGVIDSPDIPLNVSRSYLQADGAVKKISNYITRKVADKLSSLFKNDRAAFEQKWNDIKVVIEYGMLSEEKFFEKSDKFALYPTVDGNYFTFDELKEATKDLQTDKDEKLVVLYASNKDEQHSYIEAAKEKGYQVLLLDSPIVPHLIQKLESNHEKISFARVDGDAIDNLVKMAFYSGLSEKVILQHNLDVPNTFFWKELLRSEGKTIGRLDSRYTGIDKMEAGISPDYNSELTSWLHSFTPAINHYIRKELNFKTDLKYNMFGPVHPWNNEKDDTRDNLRQAMAQNPYLKVLIQSGYYDGATTYFNAKYTQWQVDPSGLMKDRFYLLYSQTQT